TCWLPLFVERLPHPATSTLFPYATLCRSIVVAAAGEHQHQQWHDELAQLLQQHEQPRPRMQALVGRAGRNGVGVGLAHRASSVRSEEHTSELQSRENLVCRPLLEKKTTPR